MHNICDHYLRLGKKPFKAINLSPVEQAYAQSYPQQMWIKKIVGGLDKLWTYWVGPFKLGKGLSKAARKQAKFNFQMWKAQVY
jgi:hypothetical protein